MLQPETHKPPRKNFAFLQILVLGLFCVLLLRLWYFQIFKGEDYAVKAQENRLRHQTIYAPRGLIRDRDSRILAENKPAYALGLIREDCPDIDRTLRQISTWTDIPIKQLQKRFSKDKGLVKPFKPQLIVSNLTYGELAKIESHLMEWPGLQIVTRPLRSYPHGEIVSHVIGYVAQVNEKELRQHPDLQLRDNIGKQGIELTKEETLRGEKGSKQIEVDAQGRVLKEHIVKQSVPGKNIRLSIDLDLQEHAWEHLGNNTGAVVVLEPQTGHVLSLVSKPGYNNNHFVQGIAPQTWQELVSDPQHPLQNRAIQSTYPPASVFKLVVTSAVLQNDTVSPEKKFYCPGFYKLGRRTFRCWKEYGHGWLELKEGIKQSCDVYFYKLGEELGVDPLSQYAQRYGFGSRTDIDLPNEKSGLIPDREWKLRRFGRRWQGGETLNMSIGQGYTLVTPLQVARYVAALINGGRLLKPQLLRNVPPETQKTLPLQEEELQRIQEAMIATVDEPHGTAWRLRMKGADIGAKTGTAQVVKLFEKYKDKETHEIPYKLRDHAWMASFGRHEGQEYVVVTLVEHGGHGSTAAGPVVKAIYDYLFDEAR
jgi:penicillin-binding protein 2